jgi:anaerobic magnesium-protoporphyrin IX monomethyl ester cyclase
MRLLLVHPRFPYRGRDAFPLGLGYLAAVAREHAEVEVVDENHAPIDMERVAADPPDIVGISSTTPSFPRAVEIAREIKRRAEETLVVMGGTHATFCPDEALRMGADVVVRGEGEDAMQEILEAKPLREIRGVSYLADGEAVHNPDRGLKKNLDELPFPAWDAFPLEAYDIMSIITSRGCPYSCVYCCASKFWRNRVRYRSPENVIEELGRIASMGYRMVRFMDSTFTLNKAHAMRICELLRKEGLEFSWSCETRADSLDEELLRALAGSGCKLLCLGVDSGSQHVLEETRRKMRVAAVKAAFRKIKKHGIATRAYVTFGFPGESEEGVRETVRLLREIQPDQILLSLATAYPGTGLWNMDQRRHLHPHPSWIAKFHGHGYGGRLFIPQGMSRKDYMRLADYLWGEVRNLLRTRRTLEPEAA